MDIIEIQKVLPHRYPFLLVDRIVEVDAGKRAIGYKNVTINEHFFQGHYPAEPIMPGVLILESMAQVGAFVLLRSKDDGTGSPLIAGLTNARFRRKVVPGDRLTTEATILWTRKGLGCMKCVSSVDGEVAAEAEITFRLPNGDGP